MSETPPTIGIFSGLSTKLIALIVLVILALEVIIFLPSLANARANWLEEKLHLASVALQVIDAVPQDMVVPQTLADDLLSAAGVDAITMREENVSTLIQRSGIERPEEVLTVDMRERQPFVLIWGSLDTLLRAEAGVLRVLGTAPNSSMMRIEILVQEGELREVLSVYAINIFLLSLTIAVTTALMLFLFLNRAILRPISNLVASMVQFRQQPENARLVIKPSNRRDEIGVAEHELAAMQTDLYAMLNQRRHLADLGLAVSKINHDLRNTLTSAQLLSDQVANLEDPQVQRLAPRLLHTLDRAIGFTQSVLSYGRQSAAKPKPQPVDLRALVAEIAIDAGMHGHPDIKLVNEIEDGVMIEVDPDQFARVLENLVRNAREALEGMEDNPAPEIRINTDLNAQELVLRVADNGPGLPPRAKDNLFVAFEGSAKTGGTGLGLSIARELAEANGGSLSLAECETGTIFEIKFPKTFVIA